MSGPLTPPWALPLLWVLGGMLVSSLLLLAIFTAKLWRGHAQGLRGRW